MVTSDKEFLPTPESSDDGIGDFKTSVNRKLSPPELLVLQRVARGVETPVTGLLIMLLVNVLPTVRGVVMGVETSVDGQLPTPGSHEACTDDFMETSPT